MIGEISEYLKTTKRFAQDWIGIRTCGQYPRRPSGKGTNGIPRQWQVPLAVRRRITPPMSASCRDTLATSTTG